MILSVSRRTDIPNYYSDWFFHRVREGFLYVRNPMNPHQISKIEISPGIVDCIVFWTKNPEDMLYRLDELKEYHYYFQFTLTGYGKDMEPNVPDKRNKMIHVFRELSQKIGKQRVIWRYDPILINQRYHMEYHLQVFGEMAEKLSGYTEKVMVSFLDFYQKTKRNTAGLGIEEWMPEDMYEIAGKLAGIARRNHLTIETCAEQIELQNVGIRHGSCIDRDLVEKITGYRLAVEKDKNQRKECGCVESIDVGAYHTCGNGCKYCYANINTVKVEENRKLYCPASPLLCGTVGENDKITVRRVKSLRDTQVI